PFSTDDAIVQYNEAYLNKYNTDDYDAGAYDCDYNNNRCVFQYNYSHDNDKGAFVAFARSSGATKGFNNDSIFRYNISQNDKSAVIRVAGATTNLQFYNNTIYLGADSTAQPIGLESWDFWPGVTSYFNNIFYNLGTGGYTFGSSSNNVFEKNV